MEYILHIAQIDNKIGGIETMLMNLYQSIDTEKFQFDFITSATESIYEKKISELGGNLYYFPSILRHPIKYYNKLKSIKSKYKIVHIHKNSLCNSLPIFLSKACRFENIIVHSHNTSATGKVKIIKNLIHSFMKIIISFLNIERISCSKVAANWMFGKKDKVSIIYNGIDIKKFCFNLEKRNMKRQLLGIKDDEFIIGHVGRFMKEKNQMFLIHMIKNLLLDNMKCKLMLIGDGIMIEECKNLTVSMGIDNNIMFLGNRSDTDELYQAMDIFVLPSLHEGLPLVGIEAQTSGLSCLFADTITLEVLITKHAETLELSLPKWNNKIKTLIDKWYDRKESAIVIENKGFSIENMTENIEKFYDRLLNKK